MSGGHLLDLWASALTTCVVVGAPFVIAALAVGLLTALVQAMTQLQDNAISFVPKIVATGLVLVLGGHWVLGRLVQFTTATFERATTLGVGGP